MPATSPMNEEQCAKSEEKKSPEENVEARIIQDTEKEPKEEELGMCKTKNDETPNRPQRPSMDSDKSIVASSSFRRAKQMLRRQSSSFAEALPETPAGWATLITTTASILLAHELRLQKSLTVPPLVFGQPSESSIRLRKLLSDDSDGVSDILTRTIKPSLFVGTRGVCSSVMAYAGLGPRSQTRLRFREHFTMSMDGATVAIDWELPDTIDAVRNNNHNSGNDLVRQKQRTIREGPIDKPILLILPGINNDSNFGYMRALMRACTDRGWIAAGVNHRGCGGIPLTTPRGYNGAYTGDLRCIVQSISSRLLRGKANTTPPIFLIGNSLGANIITKYLGEESFAGTLPSCVAGGVSLGNPLFIHPNNIRSPWAEALGLGVKKYMLENLRSFSVFMRQDPHHYGRALLRGLFAARTVWESDEIMAPYFIRNDPNVPHATLLGFRNGSHYWDEGSSYHYIRHISVPLLQVIAQDDFMIYSSSLTKLSYCLENPNVIIVKTKCGGHLGWQECPPDTGSVFGFGTSWADTATMDFIQSVIQVRAEEQNENARNGNGGLNNANQEESIVDIAGGPVLMNGGMMEPPMLSSKL